MNKTLFILQSTKGKNKKELIEERQALNKRIEKNEDESIDAFIAPELISADGLEYMTSVFDSIIDTLYTTKDIVDLYYFTYGWRNMMTGWRQYMI